jgi:hypothetical protein
MRRIKPQTIIGDGQCQQAIAGFKGHLDVTGCCMPDNIGQRFLSNSVGSG